VNAWGYVLMANGMLVFWALGVIGVAILLGRFGRAARMVGAPLAPPRPARSLA